MEDYKEAFEKLIKKVDKDLINFEEKKLEEIEILNKLTKEANEIEGK